MNPETKICQNCKKSFVIKPEDFDFYAKMKVPPPTFCPECQMQSLMMWRNERSLYKRKDESGKEIISIFSPDKPFKVNGKDYWWSDEWNPLDYGKEYDFSKPFFVQFKELLERVPLEPLFNRNAVNSEYCNHSEDMKNCYLSFASIWNENVSYSRGAMKSKDSLDIFFGNKDELTYENIGCEECYRVFFSKFSYSCRDSSFLINCSGCQNCFGCVNLRNKSYYIFNRPYTKEEYSEKIKEFDLGSFETLKKIKSQLEEFSKKQIYRYAHIINSPNSTGEILYDCKNCKWCFDLVNNSEDCKYTANGGFNLKDTYNGYGVGEGELMYQAIDTGLGTSTVSSVVVLRNGRNVSYAVSSYGSSNTFASIGLRNKQYCILNKQYTKEEYEELLPKIIKHMNDMPYVDSKGRVYKYGEFFPPELSPFAYNETIAQEYFPLTKEQAVTQGYKWKEPEQRNYGITKKPEELPDNIKDVDDSIIKEIIQCQHISPPAGGCNEQCTQAYRIIPDELSFYRRMNLALPRLCPNCRHYQRLKQRNPLRLWHGKCQCAGTKSENGAYDNQTNHQHNGNHCPNEFETSYAPNRPEIVYCENCYNSEVV
ncbi:MAG: hypothetical protein HY432_00720 [Candidatus Liptonbacteria bacterium]|nr:hypothetical protein [Candidatus Liptonbacteria bacterium]